MSETTNATPTTDINTSTGEASNESVSNDIDLAPSTSTGSSPNAKMQSDDPDGENFDYDTWAAKQGLRGEDAKKKTESKKDAKDAKKGDRDEADDDTSDSDDNDETEDSDSNDNKNNSDKNIEIKLKVNGEERTIKGMDEITKLAQMGAASNEKFQEAAQIKREIQSMFETLATNPGKIFRHPSLGQKFREAAEKYIYEELQLEMMAPELREGALAKRKLSELEQERLEQQQQFEAQEMERQQAHYKQKFEDDISKALNIGNLPKTPFNVKRTAQHIQQAIEGGYELTYDQLAELVRNDIMVEHQALIANTPDVDTLINIIGKDNVDRIRKHNIQKVQNNSNDNAKVLKRDSDRQPAGNNSNKRVFRSANEMIDYIRG